MPNGSRTSSWDEYLKTRQTNRTGNDLQDVGVGALRFFVGGPAGWGELANGASKGRTSEGTNDLLGIHFGDGTTLNDMMTEEIYNSMTPEEWEKFAHMSRQEQASFINERQTGLIKNKAAQKGVDDEVNALQSEADKRKFQQNDLIAKVQKFADEMNMSVGDLMQKDDFAKHLNAVTYQNSMANAMSSGAGGGGISQANSDAATKNALLGYQFQRQQAGLAARNDAFGMITNQGAAAEDLRRYNQGMDLQMQSLAAQSEQASYQQSLQQSGGTLGLIGGAVGAYFGGAQGAQAGYSLGSGLGQQNYMSNNPYKPYKYSYPTGGMGRGRGSGGGGISGGNF